MARKKKSFMTPKASRRKSRKKRSSAAARRKKEYTYRGFNLEELRVMPMWPSEEDPSAPSIITLLPSRARRSIARGLAPETEKALEKIRATEETCVRTEEICQFFQNLLEEPSVFMMVNPLLMLKSSPR